VNITRQELADQVALLAVQGVYVGTSSWKYPGWCGTIYDRARYEYRGKFAETRFKRDCLAEYAEVFKTVCVDVGETRKPCVHRGRLNWLALKRAGEILKPGFE
jgi:hypothetical protein